ncbi:hypothetical protein FHJ30_20700 [Arthrobacter sp. BB-1]|uniref:hypothetical protein n=1 Tax=unclassified Arthrobacter TaxID=235627 RepID=UPI0010DD5F50|nr:MULTISPECIES: hypothetical protein [unclassified Arthrobacter]TNB67198.1 hypothetical protein FHJ30_20700 [Arthrobacter sp. BB-1]VII98669.1 hypothetical protein [Arthrobacter sp. DR-2P]
MDPDAETIPTPAPGQEWAYRLRDESPSQRVQVLALNQQARKFRVEIRHLDGDVSGKEENVPRGRLKVPWDEVAQYDASMDDWKRLRDESIDQNESSAMWTAVELLIPSAVAELFLTPVDDALVIHDQSALESLTGQPLAALPTNHSWITYNGKPCLSPLASLTISKWACCQNPTPVLELIQTEEAEAREKSKRGGTAEDWETRKPIETSPQYEYERYLRLKKPIHEILRQWCGYRSVTAHERLMAAEAEVNRLDVLLAWSVDYIRRSNESTAAAIESEHEKDRITPYNIRPVPQRPLEPHELPVIEVPSRRRWPR